MATKHNQHHHHHRRRHHGRRRAAALVALALAVATSPSSIAAALELPYVPTQILTPAACFNRSSCRGQDVAYILSPDATGTTTQLLAFNYSTAIDGGDVPRTATKDLPFLKDAPANTAFGAVRTGDGTLAVYAGACDADGGDLWTFDPAAPAAEWDKRETAAATTGSKPKAPYFLGGILSFSSKIAPVPDQPTIYTYGGICASPSSDADAWQSRGNYTTTTTSLTPDDQRATTSYHAAVASLGGPKSPFASFSITQLPSSTTNMSGTVSQRASFVFMGGHTKSAFINMSTIAVWTLPEETWSFVNVQAPDTEDAQSGVESRAGHTAVLSEDGLSIVVLGGWVGDLSTPAQPQLAVLEMNQTYSSWRWKVPKDQPSGNGIFGHGAALLPGNVMMVYGGWETQPATSGNAKRQAAASPSPRFLNLTSMAWTPSYRNPNVVDASARDAGAPDAPGAGNGSATSRRLGLGLGLGLGLAFLLGIVLVIFLWRLRQRKRQAGRRDEAARAMAEDANHFLHDDDMAERHHPFIWGSRDWRTGHDASERSLGYESLRGARTSLDASPAILPSAAIARKPVPRISRAGYQPTEGRHAAFAPAPGAIHPILEDDEDEFNRHRASLPHDGPLTPSSVHSNPFITPTASVVVPPLAFPPRRGSTPPSPDTVFRRHDPDVRDWVSDVDAADALLTRYNNRPGKGSPTRGGSIGSSVTGIKDDDSRTGSNLSESARSVVESLRRSVSERRSVVAENPLPPPPLRQREQYQQHAKSGSSSSSSFLTARTGFGALQAEAPSLLMAGRPRPGSPVPCDDDESGSPSKLKPRRNWLGSLRRVFSTSGGTPPTSATRDDFPERLSIEATGSDHETRATGGLSGDLLRRKQGRHDWEEDAGGSAAAHEEPQQVKDMENEWDIERAVEQRLVQVMFTVPKERLRVVNGDDAAADDDAEGDLSASSSHQHLHEHWHEQERGQVTPQTASVHEALAAEVIDSPMSSFFPHDDVSSLSTSFLASDRPQPQATATLDGVESSEQDLQAEEGRQGERYRERFLDLPDLGPLDLDPPKRFSHSTDASWGPSISGAVLTAEAVTFERPRTRVREMVDQFERSASQSPTRVARE
ncbi:hypothetical protein DCS_02532 [Drechmeria coniospora]|uniref:Galactose oxidase n=1 Tax=Drechmeria coniospora TaxID=98403 RepID=A0A151GWE1_DRECN|nr:hypothetical protein DCS_02532 [Drechmeria coniospora]KYK61390.1 hypothetical protein DCS_02532 [Drechmeria coniospora]